MSVYTLTSEEATLFKKYLNEQNIHFLALWVVEDDDSIPGNTYKYFYHFNEHQNISFTYEEIKSICVRMKMLS